MYRNFYISNAISYRKSEHLIEQQWSLNLSKLFNPFLTLGVKKKLTPIDLCLRTCCHSFDGSSGSRASQDRGKNCAGLRSIISDYLIPQTKLFTSPLAYVLEAGEAVSNSSAKRRELRDMFGSKRKGKLIIHLLRNFHVALDILYLRGFTIIYPNYMPEFFMHIFLEMEKITCRKTISFTTLFISITFLNFFLREKKELLKAWYRLYISP